MKKQIKTIDKQLVLVRNQIRSLTGTDLHQIAGGSLGVGYPTRCKPMGSSVLQ